MSLMTDLFVDGVGLLEILLQGAGVGTVKGALGAGDGEGMREHAGGQGNGNLLMLVAEAVRPGEGEESRAQVVKRANASWARALRRSREGPYRVVGQVLGEVETEESHCDGIGGVRGSGIGIRYRRAGCLTKGKR